MSYVLAFILTLFQIPAELDCDSIKLGKFKTVNYVENSEPIVTIIERTKDFQIERSEQLGVEHKFKIDWMSDCSYRLTWAETIRDTNNFGYPTDQVLTIEIIEIGSGYYNLVASSNLFEQKIEGKVEILE
ncbi:MAG: hypothetical protein ABJH98_04450 [Reichenbachiella sp.]|uniref:hypothetical protein n=1 Tax=Reichenbachiella sp. TaxID=2184521 RepID=UPI00329899FC